MKETFEDIGIRFRQGDKKAFEQLYDRYADSLYGVLLKMVNDDALAKDILQESFVKIWKNASKYDPQKAKVFTWMYQIARNTALDKIRRRTKRSEREIRQEKSNVYKLGERKINPDVVDMPEILGRIDPKYRNVVHALFYLGMTQDEASKHLDIPLGTVKTRLKIGLRELRKIFGNQAVFVTTFIELIHFLK